MNHKIHRIYVAGPMSGIPEFNFPAFDVASVVLRESGHEVTSPAELDRMAGFDEKGCTGNEHLTDKQKHQFARRDLEALLHVDAVAVLPGWGQSAGATNEVRVARWLGLPVIDYMTMDAVDTSALPAWSGTIAKVVEAAVLSEAAMDRLMADIAAVDVVDEMRHEVMDEMVANIGHVAVDEVAYDRRLRDKYPHWSAPPAATYLNTRQEVLQTAEMLVNGDRNVQYGDPSADFKRTADLWTAYLAGLGDKAGSGDWAVEAHDVAAMMCLLKISRIAWSPNKLDSWVDLAGYAACGAGAVDGGVS